MDLALLGRSESVIVLKTKDAGSTPVQRPTKQSPRTFNPNTWRRSSVVERLNADFRHLPTLGRSEVRYRLITGWSQCSIPADATFGPTVPGSRLHRTTPSTFPCPTLLIFFCQPSTLISNSTPGTAADGDVTDWPCTFNPSPTGHTKWKTTLVTLSTGL